MGQKQEYRGRPSTANLTLQEKHMRYGTTDPGPLAAPSSQEDAVMEGASGSQSRPGAVGKGPRDLGFGK